MMGKSSKLFTRCLVIAVAFGALALGAAACGGGGSDSTGGAGTSSGGDGPKVAFFTSLGNTYLEATSKGLQEGFGDSGAEVTSFDSQFDPQKQFSQIQDAIASGQYDAFVVFPIDGNAIVPLMKQAEDAGIAVIDTDFPIGDDFETTAPQVPGVKGSVLLPATKFGEALGEMTVEACAGTSSCEVAIITGFLQDPFENAVVDYTESILAEHPEIEVVAKQQGELLAAPALAAVQNILQASPELDVVTAVGDQMASGAEKAVTAAGKTDQVQIIGASASEIGVTAVREGRWFGTSTSLPFTEGEVAAEMVLQAVRSGKVHPAGVNPVEREGLPPYISQGTLKQFPADFTGQWKG